MTLTVLTIDSVDYKSYSSLSEANAVNNVDPTRRDAWGKLDDAGKKRDLIAATNRLDLLPWRGEKAGGASQANAFPRKGLTYEDGTDVPDDAIPDALQRANALLAGSIAVRPGQADQGAAPSAVSEVKAGSVAVKFANPERRNAPRNALQDETAYQLIRQWLSGRGGTTTGAEAFGINVESEFTDSDQYDLSRGF